MAEPVLRWSFAVGEDADAPDPEPAWMTPAERVRLRRGNEKRRRQHLLGRQTAKRLVATSYGELFGTALGLDSFEIDVEESGAPRVRLPGAAAPSPSLSISHSGNAAFCAVLWGRGIVGADVERVEPRSEAFVRDFFAPEEVVAWELSPPVCRDVVANLVWSAKEAALKALKQGLTVDTRQVVCRPSSLPTGAAWRPLSIRLGEPLGLAAGIDELQGASRSVDGFVFTLVILDRGDPAVAASALRQLDAAPVCPGGTDGQVPAAAS